jgi:hypothetical protein
MAKIVRTETYKRGFFGKIAKWLFILFNVVMIIKFGQYLVDSGVIVTNAYQEQKYSGDAVGAIFGSMYILRIWFAGALGLGVLMYFTRGDKIITEETVED